MHDQVNDPAEATARSSQPKATPLAPDFRKVRRYLRTVQQRGALDRFVKASWTPAELAEYARSMYLVHGQTKPTAASYQFVIEKGPEHKWAKEALATMRAPGYIMPTFDRPEPKSYTWDDPDNPEHTPELRADVAEMARLWRNREASWHAQPWPVEDQPIPRWLWKRLFRLRNRYHSLEDTLQFEGLRGYSQPYTADDTGMIISDAQQSQAT